MKRIIAVVLVLLLVLSGCAVPNIILPGTSSGVSQNSSSHIQSSPSGTSSSGSSSENITIVSSPASVGTENTVSGSKLPSGAHPLETDTWCYNRISKEQQRIYKILLSSVNRMAYGWIDLGKCNTETYNEDIAIAYRAFTYDYPELFWVPYEYVVKLDGLGVKVAFSLVDKDNDIETSYIVPLANKKEMQEEIDEITSKIVTEIKDKTNDKMEMLTLLHDKLCNTVTYYDAPITQDLIYTVYGALFWGYTVCEGYARTMRYLCKELGIECLIVTGTSKNEQHMWNMVRLDNEWYHIDLTWNDPGLDEKDNPKPPLHPYFNVTDEVILKDHTIDPDITKVEGSGANLGSVGFNFGLPEAKGKKYDYYDYNELNFSDMLYAARKIVSIYESQNFIELALNDKQLQNYEKDKVAFISALISNIYLVSDEVDLSQKDVFFTNTGNTLYIEWNEKTQSVN